MSQTRSYYERVWPIQLGQGDLSGVGPLDRGHPRRDRHRVGVLAGCLQPFAAGNRPDEYRWVVQRLPDPVDGRVQGGFAADLHEGVSLACWHWRRSSNSSDGEIGIDVIGKPSASSMAEANTAALGMTPASPAPLIPSGFSGDGVSRWSI